MGDQPVLLERRGHVGCIRLNRPEELNTFNYETLVCLDNILDEIANDPKAIRVVIVEAEGRAFSAGAI